METFKAVSISFVIAAGLLAALPLAGAPTTCKIPITAPNGLGTDGINVWVASGSGTLVEINPTTCAVANTLQIGGTPALMAFDGANLWVTDYTGNRVVEVSPTTGAILNTFPVGPGPYGIIYNPLTKTIWIAISLGNPGYLQVMNLTNTQSWTIPTPTTTPKYLMYNGYVYVTDLGLKLSWFNSTTRALLGESTVPAPATALVYSGGHVWVSGDGDISEVIGGGRYLIYYTSDEFPECSYQALAADRAGYLYLPCSTAAGSTSLQQFSEATLTVTRTITVPSNPVDLIWVNNQLWVSSQMGNMVTSWNLR
jgi:DNA-binding beta-propeller fold protein YncE